MRWSKALPLSLGRQAQGSKARAAGSNAQVTDPGSRFVL